MQLHKILTCSKQNFSLTGDLGLYVNAGRVKQNELESECESESESESESSFTYVCISTLHLDAYANKHGEFQSSIPNARGRVKWVIWRV